MCLCVLRKCLASAQGSSERAFPLRDHSGSIRICLREILFVWVFFEGSRERMTPGPYSTSNLCLSYEEVNLLKLGHNLQS